MQVIDIVPVLQGGEYDDGLSRCAPEQMAGRTVIAFEKPRRGAFYYGDRDVRNNRFFSASDQPMQGSGRAGCRQKRPGVLAAFGSTLGATATSPRGHRLHRRSCPNAQADAADLLKKASGLTWAVWHGRHFRRVSMPRLTIKINR